MNCRVNKPYPKVKVEKKSSKTADILRHLYASNEGELSAVLQYSYETFLDLDPEIKHILHEISIVEMHHLQILGELIFLLGEMPSYTTGSLKQLEYWNSDFIYYDMDFKTILEIDMEKEKTAIQNYQMVLNVIQDIYIKDMIQRILEDEYLHIEIFQKLYQQFFS